MLAASLDADLMEGLVTTSTATMWHVDLGTEQRVPLLSAHAADVTALVPSPCDAQLMASTSADGLLRVWQIASGEVRIALAPGAGCLPV